MPAISQTGAVKMSIQPCVMVAAVPPAVQPPYSEHVGLVDVHLHASDRLARHRPDAAIDRRDPHGGSVDGEQLALDGPAGRLDEHLEAVHRHVPHGVPELVCAA